MCEERAALHEINVDTLVSTLTHRDRHQRDRLVTLKKEKQWCFSENPTREQRGSNPGRMDGWRGSQHGQWNRRGTQSRPAIC